MALNFTSNDLSFTGVSEPTPVSEIPHSKKSEQNSLSIVSQYCSLSSYCHHPTLSLSAYIFSLQRFRAPPRHGCPSPITLSTAYALNFALDTYSAYFEARLRGEGAWGRA